MSVNIDRVTKLLTQIGSIEEKINNLTMERNEKAREIQSMLGGIATPTPASAKTGPKGGNGKGSTLGEKIVAYLQSTPGKDIQSLAKALKVAPNQVGLSLFHLTKSGKVFTEQGNYFAQVPFSAAAKTAPMPNQDGD